jgi:hypothetical protein
MELGASTYIEDAKKKSISRLSAILNRLQATSDLKNHQYHMISEYGSLIEVTTKIIDNRDIDIVIMGTKGDSDSRSQIYGSQTLLVMEKITSCPVLAIPAKAKFRKIKEIVFPTGYKTNYKRKEFQHLIYISKNTRAAIRVLHVIDKNKKLSEHQLNNQKLLKDYFEGLDYSFHTVENTNVQEAIDSFILARESDMVVFINKKHNFFRWFFSKPMVKNLAYHSSIPILALHDLRN